MLEEMNPPLLPLPWLDPEGGRGVLHKVLYGEALPWGFSAYFALSNPLAFYIPFLRGECPFCTRSVDKWYLFYILVKTFTSLLATVKALY